MKQQLLSLCFFFTITAIIAQSPANDSLKNAIPLTIETNQPCQIKAGTTLHASQDGNNPYNDVWYCFTPENDIIGLQLSNIFFLQKDNDSRLYFCLQKSIDSTSLDNVQFYAYEEITYFKNLKIGEKYYLRIATPQNLEKSAFFDLCLSYAKEESQNKSCNTAQLLTVNPNLTPSIKTKTSMPLPSVEFSGFVWYKFKANSTQHIVNLEFLKTATYLLDKLKVNIYKGENCSNLAYANTHRNFKEIRFSTQKDSFYYIEVYFNEVLKERIDFNIWVTTPPVVINDDCASPIELIPTINTTFTPKTKGKLTWATSNKPDFVDVSYVFEAKKSFYFLSFETQNIDSDFSFSIYENGKNCSVDTPFLSQLKPSWVNRFEIPNLAIGKKYILLVSKKISENNFAALNSNFDIAIGEQPIIVPNDDCKNAIEVPIQKENNPITKMIVSTKWATSSSNTSQLDFKDCSKPYGALNDVWYKFTPTTSAVKLNSVGAAHYSLLLKGVDSTCTKFEVLKCIPNQSELILDKLKPNQPHFIYITNSSFDTSSFYLTALPPSPKNDSVFQAIELTVSSNTRCSSFSDFWRIYQACLSN